MGHSIASLYNVCCLWRNRSASSFCRSACGLRCFEPDELRERPFIGFFSDTVGSVVGPLAVASGMSVPGSGASARPSNPIGINMTVLVLYAGMPSD